MDYASQVTMVVTAYRAAYQRAEIARETGAVDRLDTEGVGAVVDLMYDGRFDIVERDLTQAAYDAGLADGLIGAEPLSNAAINIHFD